MGDLLSRAYSSLSAAVRPALTALVLAGLLGLPLPAAVAASGGDAGAVDAGCATPLLAAPRRASAVEDNATVKFDRAAARNARRGVDLESLTDDHALWLDRCGTAYYVEAADPEGTDPSPVASAATTVPAGVDPLALESRPGSARTIYLDFDGETVTGTAWNKSSGIASVLAEPFSRDTTISTDFSSSELDAIYQAWLVVSEDYAPFDVNVTTMDPGAAAIDRADVSDTTFGTRVLITNGGPLYDACRCGGQAYLNVFDAAGADHAYYQPAWVYADGLSKDGWNIGQASSHEAGHNFGLKHDGTTTTSYYKGSGLWAPIMGASYGRTLSQWSRGEYAGANNTQDDVAVIAAKAPLVGDDHGDSAAAATPLEVYQPVDGLIGTRSDVDAFTFAAGGPTTLTVASPVDDTDLDLEVRILDAAGAVVATVNPATADTDPAHPVPAGLGATWAVTLPEALAGYTALVAGAGSGNPLDAGSYSDYGSLGRYRISLSTTTAPGTPDPLAATVPAPVSVLVGRSFTLTPVTASGGTAPYTWTAGNLPYGVAIDRSSGTISGTMSSATGASGWPFTIRVTDAKGATVTRDAVVRAAYPEWVDVPDQAYRVTLGVPTAVTLAGHAERNPLSWTSLTSAPPGMTLDAGGVLSGTPSRAGVFAFAVRAATVESADDATVTLTVVEPTDPAIAPPPLSVSTGWLPRARVGARYKAKVALDNATPGVVWRVKGTLPRGLDLKPSGDRTSAALVGEPSRKGSYTFTVVARDGSGHVVRRSYTIRVRRAPA